MGKDSPTLGQKYHYLRINITSETISSPKSSIFRKKLHREAAITDFREGSTSVFCSYLLIMKLQAKGHSPLILPVSIHNKGQMVSIFDLFPLEVFDRLLHIASSSQLDSSYLLGS